MSDLIPISNLGLKYINDCSIVASSGGATFSITPGQMRDSTNTFDIVVPSTLTVTGTTKGANGLDSGTIANNTWYAVHVIYDPTNNNPVSAIFSLSATAPVMPSLASTGVTYGAFRLIGWVKTDGSALFLPFIILGNGNARQHYWDSSINVLTGGTSATFATVQCLAAVAPAQTNLSAFAQVSFTAATAADYVAIRPLGSTADAADVLNISGSVASVAQRIPANILLTVSSGNPSIQYINSAVSCATTINIRGFEYFI